MKRPLKILFLASWYPNRTNPFLGNFVQRHAEAISAKHEVFVVSAFPYKEPLVQRVQKANLTEITVYYRNELPFLSYLWAMRKGIKETLTKTSEFDLCHVNVAWPAGIIALYLKIPFVVTEHFSGYVPMRNHHWPIMSKSLTRKILERAQYVLPVSGFLQRAMKRFAPEARYKSIPNVVNEKLFNYSEPPKDGKFTFLHISTLENKSKNIRGLLEAVNMVAKKGRRDFRLLIGGDGSQQFLREAVMDYNSGNPNIETFSHKAPHEVAKLFAQSHALLMFSHYETQSCTILEALCSGRPVVSTEVGGIPEIIDESNSIMVEDNDRAGLARAIEKMIDTYDQFDKKQIAQEAGKKYAYTVIAQSYDEVYASVLKTVSSGH